MKKIVFIALACLSLTTSFAQDDPKKSKTKTISVNDRPGDHLMIQLSSDHWTSMPDSVSSHQKGFSRGFNAYLMTNKRFKTNPKLSIGIGIGVGSSNIAFKKINIDVKSLGTKLPFTAADSSNHFKKYKLSTSYLEAPLEFRYSSNQRRP